MNQHRREAEDRGYGWIYKIAEGFPGLEVRFTLADYKNSSAISMKYKGIRSLFETEWYDGEADLYGSVNQMDDPLGYVMSRFEWFIDAAEKWDEDRKNDDARWIKVKLQPCTNQDDKEEPEDDPDYKYGFVCTMCSKQYRPYYRPETEGEFRGEKVRVCFACYKRCVDEKKCLFCGHAGDSAEERYKWIREKSFDKKVCVACGSLYWDEYGLLKEEVDAANTVADKGEPDDAA